MQNINLTNTAAGSLSVGNYTNSFSGTIAFAGSGTPSATPIVGDADGNFVTEAANGKQNKVSYTTTWNNPISLTVEYATTALSTDLLTASTEIRVSCPIDKTLTIINPNNQILIDTNYDGIFESGVTEYSSFEIRFRLNNNLPLAAGTGTFSVKGSLINAITVTNINLVDTNTSRVALRLVATCVPRDSDNDGVPDQIDFDSDNDTIPDFVESQGENIIALSNIDVNQNGIDDALENRIPADSDGDGIPNYLDLDSDNDGIFDIIESGSLGNGSNTSGVTTNTIGTNGLDNTLETAPDSGILNFTIADSDGDTILNYIEIDSDDDGCNDVIEAGFTDTNNDGIVGDDVPVVVNNQGQVINSSGYTAPNNDYTIGAPISISVQPADVTTCELQSATFTLTSVTVDSYQWQLSTDDETSWTNLTNNATYSGVNTVALTVSNVSPSMVGYKYRVFINKNGNGCGLYSDAAVLTTYALPVITTPISLIQCDDDTDGISVFNLTQKNNVISSNYQNETFTYYTTSIAANAENSAFEITTPLAYTSGNTSVYARVENSDGCFRVAQI